MSKHKGRAQQFLPYASLRGYDEVVSKMRRISSPRRELAEDMAEEISRTLSELKKGDAVKVCYYVRDHYETVEGAFSRIDTVSGVVFVGEWTIPINDVFSFEKIWDL